MDTDTVMRSDTLTINAADLIAATKVVAAHAGKVKTLPILTAIRLGASDKGLELVATDRYRLGVATITGVDTGALTNPILVPAAELVKWLSGIKLSETRFNNTPDVIKIELLEGSVKLSYEGSSSTIRLLEGNYPDYTKLAIDAASYAGGISTINLNPKLLGEITAAYAKALGKDKPVTIHLPAEPNRPILLTAETDTVSYLSLLMATRVI